MDISLKMITDLYRSYLYGNNISFALDIYKSHWDSIYIDFLELFIKYQRKFPCKIIIENSFKNEKIDLDCLLIYLLYNFIDYFYSLNINNEKDLFKKANNSYILFIISNIIEKEDEIEKYKNIIKDLKTIDDSYEIHLNNLFNDFIKYCIECVKTNIINKDLPFYVKVFDFLSKIRDGNKNDEFYIFIKPIFFEVKPNEILSKLEIYKYKDSDKIRDDIILILEKKSNNNIIINNNFGNIDYEYLKFIKKCLESKIKSNDDDEFKRLYFYLLNTEKLISYIKKSQNSEIKNYDLTKILIENNIQNKENNNENIQNNNNTNTQNNDSNNINIQNNNNIIIQNNNNINNNIQNNNNDNEKIENKNIITTDNIIANNNTNNKTNENITNIINDNFENNNNNTNMNNSIDYTDDIDDRDSDEENGNSSNDDEIMKLKNNLITITIREYFTQQIKKYSTELKNNSIIESFIKGENNNSNLPNNILYNINRKKFPIMYKIRSSLLKQIQKLDLNYKKNFGFTVIDKREYIYAYHNDEKINNFLFESKKIKKYRYKVIISSKNMNEMKENSKHDEDSDDYKSAFSYKNTYSYNSDIVNKRTKNFDEKSNHSKSNKSSPQYNNGVDEYDFDFSKGFEFENHSAYLFKNLFTSLKDLPSYFFVVNKEINDKNNKDNKKNKEINQNIIEQNYATFSDFNNNLFSTFIETDGAYINKKKKNLTAKLENNFHPFMIQKTFVIYKKNEKYAIESFDEDLIIEPKTIIINESKLSIPKNIINFSFEQKYEKNKLSNTLIFTLNKLIRKMHFYYEFVKNEILDEKKIKDYKFLLCLIYDNVPVKDINTIVKDNLQLLNRNGYIKNEFKLKIIYIIPKIGSYNLNFTQKENKKMNKKFVDLKKDMEKKQRDMENQIKAMEKDKENQKNIMEKQQRENKIFMEKQQNEIKLLYDILYIQNANLKLPTKNN